MTEGNTMAFPLSTPHEIQGTGLTKREYFAAMAQQGMLANPEIFKLMSQPAVDAEYLALASIEQADALIEQLNKP